MVIKVHTTEILVNLHNKITVDRNSITAGESTYVGLFHVLYECSINQNVQNFLGKNLEKRLLQHLF